MEKTGIINRAVEAREKTEEAEREEKEKLGDMEDILDEYSTGIKVEQVADENPGVLEGTGTDDDPYTINSIEDLVVFASNVTNGTTYEGQTVKLGLSLDFNSNKSYVDPLRTNYGEYGYDGELKTLLTSGEGFKQIGTTTPYSASKANSFAGTFDGDNKKIYNAFIKYEANATSCVGIFGSNYGEIKNLEINGNLDMISNSDTSFLGGIVGYNYGNIINCGNNGTITFSLAGGNIYMGGITGRSDANSNIKACFNKANISGKTIENYEGSARIGGIYGIGNGNIVEKCYNVGNIDCKLNGAENVLGGIGGIEGTVSSIQSSYNIGNIEGYNSLKGGVVACGISGGNAIINNCYNKGTIIAISDTIDNNTHSAGISNKGQITNCYNVGEIISNSKGMYSRAGGIAYGCDVSNSYNLGLVKAIGGENTKIQIGGIESHTEGKNITNSYNIGTIEYEGGNVFEIGAILGAGGNKGTITNCSYLATTAEKGMGTGTDVTTRVENIEDMPTVLSVINAENCFKEDTDNINNGYPILNWQ